MRLVALAFQRRAAFSCRHPEAPRSPATSSKVRGKSAAEEGSALALLLADARRCGEAVFAKSPPPFDRPGRPNAIGPNLTRARKRRSHAAGFAYACLADRVAVDTRALRLARLPRALQRHQMSSPAVQHQRSRERDPLYAPNAAARALPSRSGEAAEVRSGSTVQTRVPPLRSAATLSKRSRKGDEHPVATTNSARTPRRSQAGDCRPRPDRPGG